MDLYQNLRKLNKNCNFYKYFNFEVCFQKKTELCVQLHLINNKFKPKFV
jgi:hypothetical protein